MSDIVPRDQVGNGQGRLPDHAVHALELEIKRFLSLKYGFMGVDGDNCAIYRVHPLDWQPGDLDFVHRWNEFIVTPSRAMWKARELVMEARERGVNTVALHTYFPLPQKKIAWPLKAVGLGVAGVFGWWLFAPPKFSAHKGLPVVDLDPIEKLLRGDAGLKELPKGTPKLASLTQEELGEEE